MARTPFHAASAPSPDLPSPKERQCRKDYWIRERRHAPQDAISYPSQGSRFVPHRDGAPENQSNHDRIQRVSPNVSSRKINAVGKQSPYPSGPYGGRMPKTAARYKINGHACQSGKKTVQNEYGPGRCVREDTEYPENSRKQVWINWCAPGRWTRLAEKRRTETIPRRDRPGNPSFLGTKMPMVTRRIRKVTDQKGDDCDSNCQRQHNHEQNRAGGAGISFLRYFDWIPPNGIFVLLAPVLHQPCETAKVYFRPERFFASPQDRALDRQRKSSLRSHDAILFPRDPKM